MNKTDIVIVGVGGQGTLLVTQIIGEAALISGMNVMASEVHGMAQRGGVVNSTVRIGDVYSPLAIRGDADIILSFEPIEALRAIEMANTERTTIITNTKPLYPFTVAIGRETYPDLAEVTDLLRKGCRQLIQVDMESLASANGIPHISANIIMVGVLIGTGKISMPKDIVLQVVKDNVPSKFIDQNVKAFEVGHALGGQHKN